jgi:ligand-binding sensor domain-containing protein
MQFTSNYSIPIIFCLFIGVSLFSCQESAEVSTINSQIAATPSSSSSEFQFSPFDDLVNQKPNYDDQIGEYITELFEDSKGTLWFGTMSKGLVKYNKDGLIYMNVGNGKCNNAITSIQETPNGDLLIGSHSGLYRYDGVEFTALLTHEGLQEGAIMDILITKNGTVLVSNWSGLYQYDGEEFHPFILPTPDVEQPTAQLELGIVHTMLEDSKGNLWFGRDGYGVCKYDGTTFTHFTKKDGLTSNTIVHLLEDRNGQIWMSANHTRVPKSAGSYEYVDSREGGLCVYNGRTIQTFPDVEGLTQNDIHGLYEDRAGHIWIASKNKGAFRYDGTTFTHFDQRDREDLTPFNCIQDMLEDSNGNFWFGFSGGLFQLRDDVFVNVNRLALDGC